ncbi:MAG TPA: phosphate ABC transporter substrate-binding protein PstS [Gaiella sp.]
MKRSALAARALVGALALALVAGQAQAASSAKKDTQLVGTGATFPFPLISKWIPEVGKAYGINITYSPTGSGAGIAGITARTVDFGASDAPLSAQQLADCKGCVVIPWALAAVSIPYNLPGLNGRVHLNGATLANMYLGTITSWNDPAIKKLNPKLTLPDTKITPVYRSDSSGTTFAYTAYLSAVSGQFSRSVGNNTSVSFPTGVGARGSSGVAGVVKNTPGALTYVDAAYSIQNKLQFAMIQNRAGRFTTPGLRGITQAVSTLPKKITSSAQLKIVDPPKAAGPLAYPITTFTYVILPTSTAKAADLRKFVYWAVTQGQKFGPPLFFVPLPTAVKAYAYRELAKVKVAA